MMAPSAAALKVLRQTHTTVPVTEAMRKAIFQHAEEEARKRNMPHIDVHAMTEACRQIAHRKEA